MLDSVNYIYMQHISRKCIMDCIIGQITVPFISFTCTVHSMRLGNNGCWPRCYREVRRPTEKERSENTREGNKWIINAWHAQAAHVATSDEQETDGQTNPDEERDKQTDGHTDEQLVLERPAFRHSDEMLLAAG